MTQVDSVEPSRKRHQLGGVSQPLAALELVFFEPPLNATVGNNRPQKRRRGKQGGALAYFFNQRAHLRHALADAASKRGLLSGEDLQFGHFAYPRQSVDNSPEVEGRAALPFGGA